MIAWITERGTIKPYHYSIHPVTEFLSDTMGVEGSWQTPNRTQLFVCMGPSRVELPNTLMTMDFASRTGKVPKREGPIKDLFDYEKSHIVRIMALDRELRITKSQHALCLTPAFPVTRIVSTIDLAKLKGMTKKEIGQLPTPQHLLY